MDGSAPKSWRLSTGQMLLMAAASLPLLASFAFCSIDRKQKPLADSIARPAIVFDQYLVNLGEIHNSASAEAHFRFKNCGTAPARITKVTPSCNCLSPRIEKRPYAPGEISDFTLRVLTTHQTPGPHEYLVTIEYEDPQPRVVTVTFKLIIRREVTIRPAQLIVYQNGIAETEQKVVLTDMRPKPFHVTSAKCLSSLVRVEVGKPIDDPEGGRETTIVIHIAAKVPPEGENCTVSLTTDDPHYPSIPVPIRIRDVHAKVTKPAATAERAEASHGATR